MGDMALAVWDARQPGWLTPVRPQRTQWLTERDVPVDQVYRVEFYDGFMRVYAYSLDQDGRKHWAGPHESWARAGCPEGHDHSLCRVAVDAPYDVPLDALPPEEILGSFPTMS